MNVIIVGAGKVGSGLAARLANDGHSVTIVDADVSGIEALNSQKIESGEISVVEGDGADPATLEMAGIRNVDVFMAVTLRDTFNGLAAQRAKHEFNVSNVFICARDEGLRDLYESLSIRAISPTKLTVDRILAGMPSW